MFERQTNQPLYRKILWNRPISAHSAGRLLIIGGHTQNVASLQSVYQIATAVGIGSVTPVVPDTLRSLVGPIPGIELAPATVAGSLGKAALAQILDLASYSDAVLIGPDLSNNSETAILIESFVAKFRQPLILADDALGLISQSPDLVRSRPNTLLILTMQQLFKLAGKLGIGLKIAPDGQITAKLGIVDDFWQTFKVDLALIGPEIIIRVGNKVSVTALPSQPASLLAASWAALAVAYAQNPASRYEGLTTGSFLLREAIETTGGATITELASGLTKALNAQE